MSFSKFRKASGRLWGNLRGHKPQEDGMSDYEIENNSVSKRAQNDSMSCSHVDCQEETNNSRQHAEHQKKKGKADLKKRREGGDDLQFHNEEHIFTARELSDVNGVHDEIANFYSTNSNGREMEKNTKNKKTGKLLEGEDIPLLSENEKRELVSLVKDKNISMDFILEMKEAFLLFDKNGDGFISAKELGVLMRAMGRNPTEDEIMQIMNEIDVDHNGKLDFSEFTIMMREKLQGEDMEEEIRQAFRVFDRNGDGFISKSEFKHCMMHFGEQFTDEEVEEMIAEADSNNDGKIDYEEFSKMILNEIG